MPVFRAALRPDCGGCATAALPAFLRGGVIGRAPIRYFGERRRR